jgi:hypothetical protein
MRIDQTASEPAFPAVPPQSRLCRREPAVDPSKVEKPSIHRGDDCLWRASSVVAFRATPEREASNTKYPPGPHTTED